MMALAISSGLFAQETQFLVNREEFQDKSKGLITSALKITKYGRRITIHQLP